MDRLAGPRGIAIDASFLDEMIASKFDSVAAFARELEVEPNAIRQWLKLKTKPEGRRIFQITDALDLDEEQINRLLCIPQTHIEFRKPFLSTPDSEIEERARRISDTFFNLHPTRHIVQKGTFTKLKSRNSAQLAEHLREALGLRSDEPASLSRTILAAKSLNLSVFFIPFGAFRITSSESKTRETAFLAERGDAKIIFLDTGASIDRLAFDLCHEIAHLVIDEGFVRDKKKVEKLCNSTAQDLLYPKDYIKGNTDLKEALSSDSALEAEDISRLTSSMRRDFNWSFMGIALAMHSYRFIKRDGYTFKKLMAMDRRTRSRTIHSLYFSNFDPSDVDTLEQFFIEDIDRSNDYFAAFFILKEAVVSEQVSSRRLAEILSIDSGDADELAQSWMRQ